MSTQNSASSYFQAAAVGTSAMGQVVALYETVLRDLRHAMEAAEAQDVDKRVNSSNHALTVIGELQGVLDFERGAEPARHLNSFYNVTRALILRASTHNSAEQFRELIAMYSRIRAAWSQVERTVAPVSPTDRLRVSSGMPANAPATASDAASTSQQMEGSAPRPRWSA